MSEELEESPRVVGKYKPEEYCLHRGRAILDALSASRFDM